MIENLRPLIEAQPFFTGFPSDMIDTIVGCAANARFETGEQLMREGEPADDFFLVRNGRVVISIHGAQFGTLTVQTIGSGEMVGWSWLVPPYRARFDAVATEPTRVLRFDGKCLREKCEREPATGYELLKRVSTTLAQRLESARIQLMDVYGQTHGSSTS